MRALKIIVGTFFACLSVASCSTNNSSNGEVEIVQKIEIPKDTLPSITGDDYPITDEMIKSVTGNSFYRLKSGNTFAGDKVWFRNDSLGQVIMIELYTDMHRFVTCHFYADDIPEEVMERIDLQTESGDVASDDQKRKDFPGFVKQAKATEASYFTSKKGFQLGTELRQKVEAIYGKPDQRILLNDREILEWEFQGDQLYDGTTPLNGKPLLRNSYGYKVMMVFRDNRIVAQVIVNEIP